MAGGWGFSAGSYRGPLTTDDAINQYPELIEKTRTASPDSKFTLVGRPGKTLFATLPAPIRGMLAAHGFLFAVAGDTLYTINSDGTYSSAGGGVIENGAEPVQMFATADDILLYDGNGNVWWRHAGVITKVLEDVQALTIADSYGAALRSNTQEFAFGKQINLSTPLVYNEWDPLDFQDKQTSTDTLKNIFFANGLLYLFGLRTIETWINTGAEFPYERYPEGYMDQGLWAKFSVCKLDESVFWLGGDDRGVGQVWRSNGQTPKRVSDTALERELKDLGAVGTDTSDAIGMTYQESGHGFYVLHFPTADITRAFDTTTNMWHKRGYWDGSTLRQDYGRYHAHAYAKHFVGDYRNGRIYIASEDIFQDNGEAIYFGHEAPIVSKDQKWMRHNSIWLDKLIGTTLETIYMQYSDDGGKTWSSTRSATVQQVAGVADGRAKFNQLGRSRNRVYKFWSLTNTRQQWVDGYLEAQDGNGT